MFLRFFMSPHTAQAPFLEYLRKICVLSFLVLICALNWYRNSVLWFNLIQSKNLPYKIGKHHKEAKKKEECQKENKLSHISRRKSWEIIIELIQSNKANKQAFAIHTKRRQCRQKHFSFSLLLALLKMKQLIYICIYLILLYYIFSFFI